MKLSLKQKVAFGLGAVGKDMVYALSASYVMFYYQDTLHLSATFVGLILMIARVFDALNDPFMGILVAKTKTRWGRFRPWLFSGTVLNAVVLYALFSAPFDAPAGTLMVYFSVVYILWGVTYTMMDIPYWSMIPAVTDTPKDRENLSVVGRTCAGVGSALIAMFTMLAVGIFGGGNDIIGFRYVALAVAVIFVITEIICCIFMKENDTGKMQVASVREMFKALFGNDQALIVVCTIVLINMSLYLTSNFIIYFFKYDYHAVFTVHGDEVLRPDQRVQQLQLFLAGVAGNVHLRHRAVHHLRAQPVQLVDHAGDELLVAGNRRRGNDDHVALADLQLPVFGICHPGQAGHRLALAARGHHQDLVIGILVEHVHVDQAFFRYLQLADAHRHAAAPRSPG